MSTDLVEKRNCGEGSLDRICDIPDVLKEKILECLPLNEAIKTSELSRNWRPIWTGMKRLTFNFNTPFFESFGRLTEVRFTRIIERILLLHHGSLQCFSIDIPRHFDSKSLYLNGLFVSLSRKKLQRLIIKPCGWVRSEFISIPSYFYDCLVLTYLVLINCALRRPPPNFQGFHNLVTLALCSVRMASKELSEFISHCPNIKTLALYRMLECCYEPLIISAQGVRHLHIKDLISGMIILKNTPCLTLVTLECLKDAPLVLHRKAYTMFELLCSLLAVEELTFDLPLLEPFNGYCPTVLKNDFVALKTLTLGRVTICSQDDIMFIFCLLRSSPNLKTLNISIKYIGHNDEDEASLKCLEVERIKGYNLSQLLNVKIAGLIGLRCETALVNIMLSSCPLLKTLRLELSSGIKIEKEAKMAWELNRCRRLSSDVELMYYNSKSQL